MKILKKILEGLKWIGKEFSAMAEIHHRMEMGSVICLKCKKPEMKVIERGMIPVGICGNCGFEM